MEIDKKVFKDKNVENLLEDLYNKQKEQEDTINAEIARLSTLIQGPGDAIVLVPFIKELLDSKNKNNEVFLKMIQLFKPSNEQKKTDGGGDGVLTEQDIQQLFEEANTMNFKKSQKQIEQ